MRAFYQHLLFAEYSLPKPALVLYRKLYIMFYIVLYGIPTILWLQEVPDMAYIPQRFSVARLLGYAVWSSGALFTLDLSLLIALVAIFFGFRVRLFSILVGLLLISSFALKFSTGKIGHGILLNIVPMLLAFSGWSERLPAEPAGESATAKDAYGVFLVALTLGFAMFTAGIAKMTGGWHLPQYFGSLYHFNGAYFSWTDKQFFLAPYISQMQSPWFWKTFDYGTLIFELGFLPAVLSKKWFQRFCAAAVLFHLAAWLIFNIAYVNNLLVYLLFIRWEAVLSFLRRRGCSFASSGKHTFFAAATIIFLLAIYILLYYSYPEVILRDKLYGPLSFLPLIGDLSFRDIRGPLLLLLSLIVLAWQFFLPTEDAVEKKH